MREWPLVTEASTKEDAAALWVGRERELVLLDQHFRGKVSQHAAIIGKRGTGKTALAYMFSERLGFNEAFPGGWRYIRATPFTGLPLEHLRESFQNINPRKSSLLFIDDYNVGSNEFHSLLQTYINDNPTQNILLCSDREIPDFLRNPLVIELGGLSQEEFINLIRRRVALAGADESQAKKLFELVAGSPLYADLAGKTIREHLVTLNEFLHGLQPFSRSGILDRYGKPLGQIPNVFKLAVVDTNQILLRKIKEDPTLLYSLDPRKFEELVAEMLAQRGYEITLTPPSKDGGLDMYAARKDDLGSFLYLVECKRYTPPAKVGVSVVRSLYGVVQQKQANGGIVVTSSFFTKGAKDFQENLPYQMHLRDYIALQKWLGIL
jgi:restriction system protein